MEFEYGPDSVRNLEIWQEGSVYELDTLLHVAGELNLAPADAIAPLKQRLSSLAKRISSFVAYQGKRPPRR